MASKGVNRVILLGNLGKDPEIRYTSNGSAIANFSIATSESWNDKNSGEKVEKTEWHRIVAFGKLAEIIGEWLKKGSQVYIEGKLQTRKWEDKDGNARETTEIVASEMQMLGGREGGKVEAKPAPVQRDAYPEKPEDKPFVDDKLEDVPF